MHELGHDDVPVFWSLTTLVVVLLRYVFALSTFTDGGHSGAQHYLSQLFRAGDAAIGVDADQNLAK